MIYPLFPHTNKFTKEFTLEENRIISIIRPVFSYLDYIDHCKLARSCHFLHDVRWEVGHIQGLCFKKISKREIDVLTRRYKSISCVVKSDANEDEEALHFDRKIANLINFEKLEVASTHLSYLDVIQISKITSLTELDISHSDVTKLAFLACLKKLIFLDLSATHIENRELIFLSELPLDTLRLSGTAISDEGLIFLGDYKKSSSTLEILDLSFTKISGTTLHYLGHFSELRNLFLNGLSLFKDPTLFNPLSELKNLEYINLHGAANFSISQLSNLFSFSTLTKLDICFTDVATNLSHLPLKIPPSLTLISTFTLQENQEELSHMREIEELGEEEESFWDWD